MSPFRLFGRPEPEPATRPGNDPDEGTAWASGPWTPGSRDDDPRPATRHARPVGFGPVAFQPRPDLAPGGRHSAVLRADDDPPTDPHGFPPVTAPDATGFADADPAPPAALDPLEAAALAGAFAADYLSWDEDDPARRGRALADHLVGAVGDPTRLGWDGRGRQRAELVLPGLVRADGDDRVLVDVRVRVTPYREIDGPRDRSDRPERATGAADGAAADSEPDVLGVPAAAPAPTARGWRGCASSWVRLSVPVVREDGRLVVDAAEEAESPAPPARRPAALPPPAELPADPFGADPFAADPFPAGQLDADPRDADSGDGDARVHALRPVGATRAPEPRTERAAPPPAGPERESAW